MNVYYLFVGVFFLFLTSNFPFMATMLKSAALFALILSISYMSSCKSEDTTCTAVIKVIRPTGAAVSGANVELISNWALTSENEVAGVLTDTSRSNKAVTDPNGEARFKFKNPAILDVKVTHITLGEGSDLIKLEPGNTVTKVVTIGQ
jgi:hypothetical protein